MSLDSTEKELLELKFKGVYTQMSSEFELLNQKMDNNFELMYNQLSEVVKQTTITNGTVCRHEGQIRKVEDSILLRTGIVKFILTVITIFGVAVGAYVALINSIT